MAENTVSVEIDIAVQEALKSLSRIEKAVGDFAKNSEQQIKKTDVAFGAFAGTLAADVAGKAFGLIKDGFDAIVGKMGDFIKASGEQERATHSLNLALAQTGKYTSDSEDAFEKWSDRLQKTTGVADDVILSNSAILQSIVKLDEQGLQRASEAAIQFSARFGVPLDTAFRSVGKAIDGNQASLEKWVGKLKDSNDQVERLNIVLQAIAPFAGSAEAKFKTFDGATQGLGLAFGELDEKFGDFITKSPVIVGATNALTTIVYRLSEALENNQKEVTALIDGGLELLIGSIKVTTSVLSAGVSTVSFFSEGFDNLVGIILKGKLAFEEASLAANKFFQSTVDQVLKSEAVVKARQDEIASLKNSIAATEQAILINEKEKNEKINNYAKINTALQEASTAGVDIVRKSVAEQQLVTDESRNKELLAIQEHQAKKNEALRMGLDSERFLRQTFDELEVERKKQLEFYEQVKDDERFIKLEEGLGREAALRDVYLAQELEKQGKHEEAKRKLQDSSLKAQQGRWLAFKSWEDLSQKDRVATVKSTLDQISTLQRNATGTWAQIGKAASIINATISTYEAINKTMASLPFPANVAASGLVAAAGFANVRAIQSQNAGGFAQGGIVGGTSFSGDKVNANVNSGEMILNRGDQSTLFTAIKRGDFNGNSADMEERLADMFSSFASAFLSQPIVVQVSGREIARAVRDSSRAGFVMA